MKVLSIEQMTRLKELGVDTSKASLRYVYLPTARSIFNETDELESEPTLFACKPDMLEGYPTFALQDVIELLPKVIIKEGLYLHLNISITYSKWYCFEYSFCNGSQFNSFISRENILDAAYQMLIWVVENGYLKTK